MSYRCCAAAPAHKKSIKYNPAQPSHALTLVTTFREHAREEEQEQERERERELMCAELEIQLENLRLARFNSVGDEITKHRQICS